MVRKGSRAGIFIHTEKQVLLVSNIEGKWGIPKGEIEHGETQLQAAEREFYEETGHMIHLPLDARCAKSGNCYVFRILLHDTFPVSLQDVITRHEVYGIKWADIDDPSIFINSNKVTRDYICRFFPTETYHITCIIVTYWVLFIFIGWGQRIENALQ